MKNTLVALAVSLQAIYVSSSPMEPRDDTTCLWMGWDTKEAFLSTPGGTYPECSAACFAQPNCKSFAYTKGDCNLYDVTVQQNINWDLKSPYLFWDRNCETVKQHCNTLAYQVRFDTFFWSNTLSSDECTQSCLSNPQCKSLAYGNGECYMYDVPTTGNIDGPAYTYRFSDVGCFKSSTTSVTSSSTTTTSKTTAQVPPTTTLQTSSTTSAVTTTVKSSTTSTTTKKSSTTTTKTTSKTTTTTTKTTSKTTTTTKAIAPTTSRTA